MNTGSLLHVLSYTFQGRSVKTKDNNGIFIVLRKLIDMPLKSMTHLGSLIKLVFIICITSIFIDIPSLQWSTPLQPPLSSQSPTSSVSCLCQGEDKKYRPPSDISGPLLVLEHIVQQPYFPRPARKTIAAFMDKWVANIQPSTDWCLFGLAISLIIYYPLQTTIVLNVIINLLFGTIHWTVIKGHFLLYWIKLNWIIEYLPFAFRPHPLLNKSMAISSKLLSTLYATSWNLYIIISIFHGQKSWFFVVEILSVL